jgi:hypothetical protein
VGLMWNLAARDATLQHRMVAAGVPELCANICCNTSMVPPLREKSLGLLQCLFEGSSLSAASVPRMRALVVESAVALMDRGDEWAWKESASEFAESGVGRCTLTPPDP